jgi:hypothetical protein
MFAKHWIKVTVMTLFGLAIIVASCSDDPLQPVIVDIGGTMVVAHISPAEGDAISIDGNPGGPDVIWDRAEEFMIVVQDSINRKDLPGYIGIVRMKALTDSTYFYLLVEWDDPTRDVQPDRWIYVDDQGGKNQDVGGQDFFVAMFEDGVVSDTGLDCYQMCHLRDEGPNSIMRNDGPGMIDAWSWKSGQTDPVSTLEDKHFPADDTVLNDHTHSGTAFVWKDNFDEIVSEPEWMHQDSLFYTGDFLYNSVKIHWKPGFLDSGGAPFGWPAGAIIPGYVLGDSVVHYEDESLWEIEAKGTHDEATGIWQLELKRRLDTGFEDDIPFVLGERFNSAIGVTNNPNYNSSHEHYGSDPFIIQF